MNGRDVAWNSGHDLHADRHTRTGALRGNEADLASGVVYINGVRVVNRGDKKVAA